MHSHAERGNEGVIHGKNRWFHILQVRYAFPRGAWGRGCDSWQKQVVSHPASTVCISTRSVGTRVRFLAKTGGFTSCKYGMHSHAERGDEGAIPGKNRWFHILQVRYAFPRGAWERGCNSRQKQVVSHPASTVCISTRSVGTRVRFPAKTGGFISCKSGMHSHAERGNEGMLLTKKAGNRSIKPLQTGSDFSCPVSPGRTDHTWRCGPQSSLAGSYYLPCHERPH